MPNLTTYTIIAAAELREMPASQWQISGRSSIFLAKSMIA